jgi:hypothetical protein
VWSNWLCINTHNEHSDRFVELADEELNNTGGDETQYAQVEQLEGTDERTVAQIAEVGAMESSREVVNIE